MGPADNAGSGEMALPAVPTSGRKKRHRGQVLPIFALSIFVILGMAAIVIDVSWYWVNTLRIQRAADAAALAGVVKLPGDPTTAVSLALAEATRNGYTVGSTHCVNALPLLVEPADKALEICAVQDADPHQLDVAITAPVQTFFMKIFGIKSIQATALAKAQFTLPVPMGSPDTYYGDFGAIRTVSDPDGSSWPLTGPAGQSMTSRGFWGTMLSQGAVTLNGDAYIPYYDCAANSNGFGCPAGTTSSMPQRTDNHYDYAIYMPPGSTGGQVYIFDPVFCATDGTTPQFGAGDRWFSGACNKVSSYYYLYADTKNTPYTLTDDTLIGTSGTLFQDIGAHDNTQIKNGDFGYGSGSDCSWHNNNSNYYGDGRDWHDRWWEVPLTGTYATTGLTGAPVTGTTYRLRTTTDPRYQAATSTLGTSADPVDQNGVDAMNGFAIYATASGGGPQVYGQGAMEMYTPLPGGQKSRFFLAQIDQTVGAGKTMEINLWDPGDTGSLTATMRVLAPCATGCAVTVPNPQGAGNWSYNYTNFDVSAQPGTNNPGAASCSANAITYATSNSLETSNGGSKGLFNGCWVTIDVTIPTTYTAPSSGWWMVEYDMGSGSSGAFDVTTWQVNVVGNPGHLGVP